MSNKPRFLVLNIGGKDFPMLETQRKPRPGETEISTYYCFRESGSKTVRFGVKIPAQGEHLPTQVTVDGVVVYLELGKTAASYKEYNEVVVDGKVKRVATEIAIPEEKRRPEARSQTFQTIPSLVSTDESAVDSGIRNVEVSISETQTPGVWNVKAVVNRSGLSSASPEAKAENVVKAAANRVSEFDAILASLNS